MALLFAATGCTALLAEQAFEKLLSTLLGATTPAAATVLAVYFGGLTIGGLLYGPVFRRLARNGLRRYALLEGAVMVWIVFLYLGFDRLIALFVPLLAWGVDHFWLLQSERLLVAACWILPATIPMGATFPAIVDVLAQLGVPHHGRTTSRFYGCNLLGGIVAAFGGPFVAFPHWGVDKILLVAALVNLSVCVIALGVSAAMPVTRAATPVPDPGSSRAIDGMPMLVALAAFSGLLFFSLEVVWTHLIATVIGNTVYAFAAMLAMVLLGLGLGAAMAGARFPGERDIAASEPGMLLLLGAVVIAATSGLWPKVPDALATFGGHINSFAAAECLRWLVAGLLLVPTSAILGVVYPSLFRLEGFPIRRSGAAVGRLVAANALGSIAGALATGFALIPLVGSERSLAILGLAAAAVGLFMSIRFVERRRLRRPLLFAAAAVVAPIVLPRWNVTGLTSGRHVYFANAAVGAGTLLEFFHEDTLGGFTTVVDNIDAQGRHRTLLTNGKFQGNDGAELAAETAFALVPILFVPDRGDALSIGLGTGRTAFTLSAMGFRSVDIAEIAPGIVDAARYFEHINGSILERHGARLYLEDGRNLLLLRSKRYDLITIEITSVWFAGATNVYSREFYELARARIKDTGVLQQWIQLHHIGFDDLGTVLATLRSVFPYVSFWTVGGQGLVVASINPQDVQPTFFAAVEKGGASIGWDPADLSVLVPRLLSSRLLAPDDVDALLVHQEFVLNSDRNRRLEYSTPRYNNVHRDFATENVRALASFASFPPPSVARGDGGRFADLYRDVTRTRYEETLGLAPPDARR